MGTTKRNHLSLVKGNMNGTRVCTELLIDEQSESLIANLSSLMGKDPSCIMNEAIGDLIKRYRPAGRNRPVTLKLIKT